MARIANSAPSEGDLQKPRTWDTGLRRPCRPCPRDFREIYLQLGQSKEIEEHYRTNWRVIRRWIEEAGGDDLREDRARITGSSLHPKRRSDRARNYVLGRTVRLGQ